MPRESKAAVGGVSTERDQAWLTKPLTSVSVLCLAFVLAVSGGVAASVVPLPCGFYSEYTVEGAAAQEKTCWGIQVGQKGSAGKGKSHMLPVLLWWRTQNLPGPVYLLSLSLPGELFDAELIWRLQSPYQLHAYFCLFLFWSSLPCFAITHRVLGVAPAVPQWRIFIQHLSLLVTPVNVTPAFSSSIRYAVQTLVKPWLAVRKATRPTGNYHGIFKSRWRVLTLQVWFGGVMVVKDTVCGAALGVQGHLEKKSVCSLAWPCTSLLCVCPFRPFRSRAHHSSDWIAWKGGIDGRKAKQQVAGWKEGFGGCGQNRKE